MTGSGKMSLLHGDNARKTFDVNAVEEERNEDCRH
jgi:hypothetical protein